ncbi:FkbM family methyltransferase [Thermodesulfobacteriota bacterium]
MKILKKIALKTLDSVKSVLAPMTENGEMEALLNTLHPVSTDKKLIRLGPNGDGGYLVPDDLTGIEACFSPGVGLVSGFERDIADSGMKVFMADNSVEGSTESHELFNFTKKNVGAATNDDFMTLDDWVKLSIDSSNEDLLLQIDIEGCEYETFLGMSDGLMNRFRIIVAEFHCLDQLWNRPFFRLASRVFERILQTHICVHLHPNNCCGSLAKWNFEIPRIMEFTFLRKDRVGRLSQTNFFPHPLDFDNTDNPILPLPECWYKRQ